MHILLVEDDPKLANVLLTIFKNNLYDATHVNNITDGLNAVMSKRFDLIILDWMLDKQVGIDLLKDIRSYEIKTPVLMLTAVNETAEKVRALDLGADDYLTKPFLTEELLARIRALTRRESTQKQSIVTVGTLVLNAVERNIFDNGVPLELTTKEFCLLEFMMRNKNRVFTRDQLSDELNRDLEHSAMSNVVDVHIGNIRKKISNPKLIETVH